MFFYGEASARLLEGFDAAAARLGGTTGAAGAAGHGVEVAVGERSDFHFLEID
jgi:hypothetical protein